MAASQAVELNQGFYGRQAEAQLLTNALLSTPGEILVLLGAPGCGKTALLRAVRRGLRASGHRCVYIDTARYDMSHTPSLARELVVQSAHWLTADLDRLSSSSGNLLSRMAANAANVMGREAIWNSPLLRRLERAIFRIGGGGAAAAALARLSSYDATADEEENDELTVLASSVLDLEGKPVELNDVLRLYDELLSRPTPLTPAAVPAAAPAGGGGGGSSARAAFIIDGCDALRHCLSLRQRRAQPLMAGAAATAAAAALVPADRETGALLRFLVRECCQERRARAVLVTNDGSFVEWLGDTIGYYNFRTEVLGDFPREEVSGFLRHLRPGLTEEEDLSPHNVDRIFEVCGGNSRALVRWAAEYGGDLDAALYRVSKDVSSQVRQALSSPPSGAWTRAQFATVVRHLAGSTTATPTTPAYPSCSAGAAAGSQKGQPRGDDGGAASAHGRAPGHVYGSQGSGGDVDVRPAGVVLQEVLEAALGPGGSEALMALMAARLLCLRPAFSDWARDVPATAWRGRPGAPMVTAASPMHLHAIRRLAAEVAAAEAGAEAVDAAQSGCDRQAAGAAAGASGATRDDDGGGTASGRAGGAGHGAATDEDTTMCIEDVVAEVAAWAGAATAVAPAAGGDGDEEGDLMLGGEAQELADTWWEIAGALQEVEDAIAAVCESQAEGWKEQLEGLWASKEQLLGEQQQLLARRGQDAGQ